MDTETKRKLRVKQLNEHIKLFVTTVNAIALVIFGAGVLQPIVAQSTANAVNWSWVMLAAILHLLAQAAIRLIRHE